MYGTFYDINFVFSPLLSPSSSLSLCLCLSLLVKILDLLQDFQILIYVVVPELLRALRSVQVQLEKNGLMCNLKHHKVSDDDTTGTVSEIYRDTEKLCKYFNGGAFGMLAYFILYIIMKVWKLK